MAFSSQERIILCFICKHFDKDAYLDYSGKGKATFRCKAFSNESGIPDEILESTYDHREKHPYDNGVQFQLFADHKFLEKVFKYSFSEKETLDMIYNKFDGLISLRIYGNGLPPIASTPEKVLDKLIYILENRTKILEALFPGMSLVLPQEILSSLIEEARQTISESNINEQDI